MTLRRQQRGSSGHRRMVRSPDSVDWSYDNRRAGTTWELFMSSARRIHLAASFSGPKASALASAPKTIVCQLGRQFGLSDISFSTKNSTLFEAHLFSVCKGGSGAAQAVAHGR